MDNFLQNYSCQGELLKIFTYPAPVLAKKAVPVSEVTEELVKNIRDMLYTMYQAPGIGLAAPQIGKSQRYFVMDIDYDREEVVDEHGNITHALSNFAPQVFINPNIISKEGEFKYEEGCLSLPGFYEEVVRAEKIVIEYLDIFGHKQTKEAHGLEAVCIQHENDHLDGIVFIDRISLLKRNLIKKKILKEKKKVE